MADCKKYGRTNNLFDTSNAVIDKYVTANGDVADGALPNYNFNYVTIPVTPNSQYSFSFGYVVSTVDVGTYMGTHRRIIAYDSNGDFLSQIVDIQPNNNYTGGGTFTTPNNCYYISINYINTEKPNYDTNMMLNTGSTALPYQPYLDWQHSLRKLTTATEAVENPLYSDGTPITSYTIKGNTVQNGTPTPDNPVDVNGVGERTENLFDYETMRGGKTRYYLDASGNEIQNNYWSITKYIPVDGTVFTVTRTFGGTSPAICLYDSNQNFITGVSYQGEQVVTISSNTNAAYIRFSYFIGDPLEDVEHDMLNTGSTAKPHEPYGYKIPISSGGVTTNIYLGSTQTVRQIKKLVLDGTENWVENLTNHGYRFGLNVSDSMQSDTTDVRSLCTHLPLTVRGGTGLDVQNVYVISATRDLIIKLSNSDRLSDLKTWLSQQYANGTPVTVWYVLATPETAAVNEPLMKIGDYADTLSNAASIPTTEGANSITVDTTVQPSEFTATWTGWHDASVNEKSENLFDTTWEQNGIDNTGNPTTSSKRVRAYVDVEPNTEYTFSSSEYIRLIYGYSGTTKIGAIYDISFNATKSYTFTTGATANRLGIALMNSSYSQDATDIVPTDVQESMLNTGSTAVPYEPYWK